MQIITVQHTQAEHHLNGMVGGSSDWPLTPLGQNQAGRIAEALRKELGEKPDYVLYASDMIRTTQTAQAIAEALGLPIVPVPEMREIKVGSATGKSRAWLKEHQARADLGSSSWTTAPCPTQRPGARCAGEWRRSSSGWRQAVKTPSWWRMGDRWRRSRRYFCECPRITENMYGARETRAACTGSRSYRNRAGPSIC